MKTVLKITGGLVGLVVLAGAGTYTWATVATHRTLSQHHSRHEVDIPVPWPLSAEELAELQPAPPVDPPPTEGLAAEGAAEDGLTEIPSEEGDGDGDTGEADEVVAEAVAPAEPVAPALPPLTEGELAGIAMERAIARGEHLLTARYACGDCHGADLGGGVMVDDPALGGLFGPNLTLGEGGVTRDFTMTQWDHIVRHGVKHDGTAAVMPSVDFLQMSDQELSDLVAAIRARPPVDRTMPESGFGPLGRMLVATGNLPLAAQHPASLAESHRAEPPAALASVEFGKHLSGICTGCHGPSLAGGPIPGGDPSWPPSTNITMAADGLQDWSYLDFEHFVKTNERPDGSLVREPMTYITPALQQMTETERQALWLYLESLPRTVATSR